MRPSFHGLLVIAAWACSPVLGQTTVTPGSFAFSDGVHPTLDFVFEGTNARYVEAYWHDELRKMAMRTTTKRGVVAYGVVLPQVSRDTVRIQVVAEGPKGSPHVTAHVAILTTDGYVAPGTGTESYRAARDFVQHHSTALRRQLAQQELTIAERRLSILKRELAHLEREQERKVASISRSRQRATDAADAQRQARDELEEVQRRMSTVRRHLELEAREEDTKELALLAKDEAHLTKRLEKARSQEASMYKKANDLERTMQRNANAQTTKQAEVDRQRTLVEALREKLATIE